MKHAAALRATDQIAPYGVARGSDSGPAMLDFRGHNGTSFALPYQQLAKRTFTLKISSRLMRRLILILGGLIFSAMVLLH